MPIVINKDTGLAENLPDADAALQAGTHEIPLYDPQGNFGSAAPTDAPDLLQQGYTQPNSEQLQQLHKEGKYGTTSEQLKTGLEGAASAATFGLSTGAERALGVNPEDINARRDVNPGVHALGEAAGLGTSMLTGVGEGALLGRAAEAIMPTIEAASFAGRVGSAAAKSAIENMIFSTGDEGSKLFASDPHQSVETAMADIGLSGLIGGATGGAFGSASELWKSGPGKNLDGFLSTIKKRTEGLPSELKESAGINVPPELEAALSGDPAAERMFQTLQESNSNSGLKAQQSLDQFRTDAGDAALSTLGKSPADIDAVHNISDYDAGKSLKDSLTTRMKEIVEPVSKKYDEFAEKFKGAPLTEELKADVANKVASSISELGLKKAASDTQLNAMNKFLQVLPKQENVHDLKLLATNLTEQHPFGSDTYRVGKILKGIVNDAQETALGNAMAEKAPQLLGEYKATQAAYRDIKNMIGDLNDRLHVGKSYGPQSFIQNIKEAAPEDILRRLSPKGDVEMQQLLQNSFPEVAEGVRSNELNKILKSSLTNGELNTKKLFNNIEKLSPEMRSFVLSQEQVKRMTALQELMNRIPDKLNSSGTAKTLDKLWEQMPASAAGIASMLLGHSPVAGYILGKIGQHVTREVPDAMRLAMLKFLGSSADVSAESFLSMTKLASATMKGERLLQDGVKNVVGTGGKVIPFPTPKSIKMLEEQVKRVAEQDPEHQQDMMSIGGATGHYMPDHGAALAMTGARNLQYLASLRPPDKALSPLDSKPVPNSEQLAKYDRALKIAEQPLIVLNSVKRGNVTVQDISHLKTMYPALYERMNQKLMDQLVNSATKGKMLPYSTKMGISSFMGQPLDSTMTPNSIVSIQQGFAPVQSPQQGQVKPTATGMESLQKMPGMSMTPGQNREYHRGGRH